jgi:cell filamentation protein
VIDEDDPYLYPGVKTLRNRLGITSHSRLQEIERLLVADRISEGAPTGWFDLAHLQAIHRHLFQDIYDWAGELRTVEIYKGAHQFQFCQYIKTGMADVHRRLQAVRFLRGLSASDFAREAAIIIGDVNYVHPFREGNGRTQMQYLKQLASKAGHDLDFERIKPNAWLEASKASFATDYSLMAEAIRGAIVAPHQT